jgi:hypothetical protein
MTSNSRTQAEVASFGKQVQFELFMTTLMCPHVSPHTLYCTLSTVPPQHL